MTIPAAIGERTTFKQNDTSILFAWETRNIFKDCVLNNINTVGKLLATYSLKFRHCHADT